MQLSGPIAQRHTFVRNVASTGVCRSLLPQSQGGRCVRHVRRLAPGASLTASVGATGSEGWLTGFQFAEDGLELRFQRLAGVQREALRGADL